MTDQQKEELARREAEPGVKKEKQEMAAMRAKREKDEKEQKVSPRARAPSHPIPTPTLSALAVGDVEARISMRLVPW